MSNTNASFTVKQLVVKFMTGKVKVGEKFELCHGKNYDYNVHGNHYRQVLTIKEDGIYREIYDTIGGKVKCGWSFIMPTESDTSYKYTKK